MNKLTGGLTIFHYNHIVGENAAVIDHIAVRFVPIHDVESLVGHLHTCVRQSQVTVRFLTSILHQEIAHFE